MDPSLLCIIFDCHPVWPHAHAQATEEPSSSEYSFKKSRIGEVGVNANATAPKINLNQVLIHTAVFINAFWLSNRHNKLITIANCVEKANVCFPQFSSIPVSGGNASIGGSQADSKKEYTSAFDVDTETHKVIVEKLLDYCTNSVKVESITSNSNSSNSNSSSSSSSSSSSAISTIANSVSLSLCMINKLLKNNKELRSRILIVQNSPDYSHSYNPLMNAVFSADKLDIPIDTIVLSSEPSTLMQQTSYVTGGVHFHLPPSQIGDRAEGYLHKLMTYVLPSKDYKDTRKSQGLPRELVSTSSTPHQIEIDFRASCSCHMEKKDIVNMCSVCLSLFCEPIPKCLICGTPAANK